MQWSRKADRQYALVSRPATPRAPPVRRPDPGPARLRGSGAGLQRLAALHGDVQELVRRRLSRADHADQRHLHELPRRLQGARCAEVLGLPQARPGDVLVAAARGLHGHLPHLHQDQRPALVHDRLHPRRERPSRGGRIRQDLPLLSRREHRRGGAGHQPAPRRGGRRRSHVLRVPQRRRCGRPDRARGPRHRLRLVPQRHGPAEQRLRVVSRRQRRRGGAADRLHQLAGLRRRRVPRQGREPRRHPDQRRVVYHVPHGALPDAGGMHDLPSRPAGLPPRDGRGATAGRLRGLPRRRHRGGEDVARDACLLGLPRGHGAGVRRRPSAPRVTRRGSSARPPAPHATARPA